MKTLTFFIFALFLGVSVSAQAPQSFRYQAVARDNSGNILASQPVSFRISILSGSVSGTAVYSETYTGLTTNAFGLVELEIGKGTPVTGTFSAINWGSNSYFVKVEMDPAGGSAYQGLSTSQLLSVPYALHAKTAETANDAATKAYVDVLLNEIEYLKQLSGIGTVEDIDKNIYKTIKIGTQTWMAENLKTTKYKDCTGIPLVEDNTAWGNLATPGYCWYNNDKATYGNIYGVLYNWHTVNTGKLCPTGWHVPSDAEWTTLTTFLGGESVAGGKMKEPGTTHWYSTNIGVTNESGFSALPGGCRGYDGTFYGIGSNGHWWSSTESSADYVWSLYLTYNYSHFGRSYREMGFSVRCVRDN